MCDVFYRRILPGRSESVDHLNYLPNDMKPSCPPGAQPHRSKNLHGTHVGAAPPDSAFTSTFITKPQSAKIKSVSTRVLSIPLRPRHRV